jgi:hypothetical protein
MLRKCRSLVFGRRVSLALAIALLLLSGAGANAEGSTPRLLQVARVTGATVTAPTLVGNEIVWGEETNDGAISIRARGASETARTLFRARLPDVPDDAANDSFFKVTVAQVIGEIAGSPSRVAFLRLVTLVKEPRCRPGCGAPTIFEPLFSELWTGAPDGHFRRVAGGAPTRLGPLCRRIRPTAIDLSGSRLLFAERVESCQGDATAAFRESRLVLARGGSPQQLLLRSKAPISPVATAGRFAAWGSNVRSEPAFRESRPALVTVYDLERRRVSYRISADELKSTGSLSFDLQSNGTIAVAAMPRRSSCPTPVVSWASRASPKPHVLRVTALATYLRIARNRILLSTPDISCGHVARLELVSLDGRVSRLASFSNSSHPPLSLSPEVDFDGHRFVLAVTRAGSSRGVTSIYLGRTQ